MSMPSATYKLIRLAAYSCVISLGLPACRDDEDSDLLPLPSPSPSPSASPTPTPFGTATPSPTPALVTTLAAKSPENLTAKIAAGTAAILEIISNEARENAATFNGAVNSYIANPTPENRDAALRSLVATRLSFLTLESAVFFTDPTVEAETLALPDPANIIGDRGPKNDFDTLGELIALYDKAGNDERATIGQSLAEKSAALALSLSEFSDGWTASDGGNFRNAYFMRSSDDAIARIFQGIATVTDIILPEGIMGIDALGYQTADPISSEEAIATLLGIECIFSGNYQTSTGALISGPGLKGMIGAVDPETSQAIDNAFLETLEFAKILNTQDPTAQQALLQHVKKLNQQLASAANNSGFLLIETAP